jgi:hypothetical protein
MIFQLFSDDQLRDMDIDALKLDLREKLGGYIVAIKDVRAHQLLYRGVICSQRPDNIDRISYPPPEKVIKLGRVNRVNKPMFYCSMAGPGVFFELRARQGDHVALSEWEVMEPLWMHNIGYHQDALRQLGVSDGRMHLRLINPIPGESEENAKLRSQLSMAFTEDIRDGQEHRYKQSIAINELLFGNAGPLATPPGGPKYTRASGTVYPAMQLRGAADNLAIWPEFVKSSLQLKSVRYVLIEDVNEATSSYTCRTVTISHEFPDGTIIWEGKFPDEDQFRSHIAFEDGNWVLRNGYGQIYAVR